MNIEKLAGYFVEPIRSRTQVDRLEQLLIQCERRRIIMVVSFAVLITSYGSMFVAYGSGSIPGQEVFHTWLKYPFYVAVCGLWVGFGSYGRIKRDEEEITAILESLPWAQALPLFATPSRQKRWSSLYRKFSPVAELDSRN